MTSIPPFFLFFFFNDTATTEIYTLSLHDALPIWRERRPVDGPVGERPVHEDHRLRSEEHTSELQSPYDLVCRLLLEKKKKTKIYYTMFQNNLLTYTYFYNVSFYILLVVFPACQSD